ncbi:MAG: 2TM domain-containing protein [Actinomycetota bacterium]|nr:2TM domain-containing protein [Actinomycetota bacterium]
MTNGERRDEAVERARKRVKELRDFYVHVAVYVVVNIGLVLLDLAQGDGIQWAYWVMIGWGIGLAAHAVSFLIFESRGASRWEARKLAEFTEQEERNLDEP